MVHGGSTIETKGKSTVLNQEIASLLLLLLFFKETKTLAGFEPTEQCSGVAGYAVQVDSSSDEAGGRSV